MNISAKIFEGLVNAHSRELFAFALNLCRDRALAEDLVQETFLRAWRSLGSLNEASAARAWLYTILRNEHARSWRKVQGAAECELDSDVVTGHGGYDTSTEAWALRNALGKLPETYREPLLLQVLGGFSGSEIASILDITQANALARVCRARRMLRDVLESGAEIAISGDLS